ncbi:MAG: ABC transporter ATP-binding protein [SAR324 cluster bacterium]|nr:ABC transporter ATP-binding protein [SAR324 cluster bacterium]
MTNNKANSKNTTTTPSEESFVKFVDVHKSFGDFTVFDGLNLNILKGKINFVVGRSGSGKSVMLKHILGFLQPDRGDIFIENKNTKLFNTKDWQKTRKKVGMLFQDSALFDSMSVFENVAFPIREHTKKSEKEIKELVSQKLSLVGLDKHHKKLPAELSGGMRKRVALSRAIALNPDLVLFDEPSSGLDPIVSSVVDKLILDIHSNLKSTFLIISHDMKGTLKIAHRVSMLYDGKLVFNGTSQELTNTTNPLVKQFVHGRLDGPFNIFY